MSLCGVGKRFGGLVITSREGKDKHNHSLWRCECDCGNECVVVNYALTSGNTKSCGCLKTVAPGRAPTHGMCGTPTYSSWLSMIDRCSETGCYRKLGIAVCDKWKESFETFLHDMGERPNGTTIDRINGKLGYEPNNCRWATPMEQARNKSNNVVITAFGRTMCVTDWATRLGASKQVIHHRLKAGWSVEDAVSVAVGGTRVS